MLNRSDCRTFEPISAAQVLQAERLGFMSDAQCSAYADWQQDKAGPPPEVTPDGLSLAALCLSGGGIRSAAFCLGVVQVFAARGMLKQFHYLSTVSGGGYIGGWLTRCIAAWKGDLAKVEGHLNVYQPVPENGTLRRADHLEPPELRRLRRYTNFLTPDPGLASTDTWATVILWVRNTLINWAVFSPLFLAAAGVPVLYYALICLSGGTDPAHIWYWIIFNGLGLMSLLCIGFTNFQVCISLPTHWKTDDRGIGTGERGFGLSTQQIFRRISLCSLLWTFLAPLAMAPLLCPPEAAAGVHAAFWGVPDPAPLCPLAANRQVAVRPQLPAHGPCRPVPATVPSLAGLLPRLHRAGPVLQQISALWILPVLLWFTYQLAFLLAERFVARKFKKNLAEAPKLAAVAAHDAAVALAENDPEAVVKMALAQERQRDADQAARLLKDNMEAFKENRFPWMISGVIGAVIIYAGLRLDDGQSALWLALAGPLWITGAEIVRSAAYVAVRRGGIYSDLDREWLARITGGKLRVVLGICALGTAAVFLPWLVLDNFSGTYASIGAALTLAGSGSLAAFLGQSARTVFTHGVKPADDTFWTRDRVIMLFATLFGMFLFIFAGRLVMIMAYALDRRLFPEPPPWPPAGSCQGLAQFAQLVLILCVCLPGLAGLAFAVDRGVNLNRFSMHAVYRNRIIRAFLGTARTWFVLPGTPLTDLEAHQPERLPNRYTGFGPQDNMRFADAIKRHPARLFHVINTTLNRTTGKDTARAARKGEPFTITPLHCGSPSLNKWRGAYVRTVDFAGGDKETGADDQENGITLGTALAISGAAVSPNMGYNSSTFTAFLMTLFNVRLGAWLPNPASRQALHMKEAERTKFFQRAGPLFSIPTLMQELTGQSDDRGNYVYLSDGGHFDNLGLYEMLRRRCRYIFVVDAGADKEYGYFDLGHTLEMASIDLGVQISFTTPLACTKLELSQTGAYAAITYPPDEQAGLPGATGHLLYLKPWLPADAPIELQSYKQVKTDFPHEPTEDQFFTESDFESYRRLGEFLANNMLTRLNGGDTLAGLFDRAAPETPTRWQRFQRQFFR